MKHVLTENQFTAFADLVRDRMGEKGWKRKELCNRAKVGDSVIGKVLRGEAVHNTTTYAVAKVLGIDLSRLPPDPDPAMPATAQNHTSRRAYLSTGAYTRDAVRGYEGQYITFRPSLDGSPTLRCFLTAIEWDEPSRSLEWKERGRLDAEHSHGGLVHIPANAGFLYLVSGAEGWVRNVTLCPVASRSEMRGTITTLYNVGGPMHVPVVAPIVYRKVESIPKDLIGVLAVENPKAAELIVALRETASKYVHFITMQNF